jgi:recombination protein RecT
MTTALTIPDRVFGLEKEFNEVNSYRMNFAKEAQFALQLLKANEFLAKTAAADPASLEYAIINLASIGISLNPATKEAYLVPRKGKICLDITAIGLIKLATDSGSIEWAQSKLVHQKDHFVDNGPGKQPTHTFEAFGDRGPVIGVYAIAKTHKGDFLTETMSIKECHDIRDRSEAWKSYVAKKTSSCPWSTDEGEMLKKTILNRSA